MHPEGVEIERAALRRRLPEARILGVVEEVLVNRALRDLVRLVEREIGMAAPQAGAQVAVGVVGEGRVDGAADAAVRASQQLLDGDQPKIASLKDNFHQGLTGKPTANIIQNVEKKASKTSTSANTPNIAFCDSSNKA
jgi:hypothetical protein